MRRLPAMMVVTALAVASCGDASVTVPTITAAPMTTTTAIPTTTSTTSTPSTTSTTTAATTTSSTVAPTTVPPADEMVLGTNGETIVYGRTEIHQVANGTITVVRPRIEIPYDPTGADAVNSQIDSYVDRVIETFAETDRLNPGEYPNEFFLTVEATLVHMYYLSLRFDEYYGIMAAAHPSSALTGFVWEIGAEAPMTPAEMLLFDGPERLLAMVEAEVIGQVGEMGIRIHLDDMVLTPAGIEVAIDETDGIPHVFGWIIAVFEWAELADVVNVERLWWLVGEYLGP